MQDLFFFDAVDDSSNSSCVSNSLADPAAI